MEQTQIRFKYAMHVKQCKKTINGKQQSHKIIVNVVQQTCLHPWAKTIKNFHYNKYCNLQRVLPKPQNETLSKTQRTHLRKSHFPKSCKIGLYSSMIPKKPDYKTGSNPQNTLKTNLGW